jgi:hypothetical protein
MKFTYLVDRLAKRNPWMVDVSGAAARPARRKNRLILQDRLAVEQAHRNVRPMRVYTTNRPCRDRENAPDFCT